MDDYRRLNDESRAELIDRLRARAADPSRRADSRESQFGAEQPASLASLLGRLQRTRQDLDRAVAASRAGTPVPELQRRADAIEQTMTTPAARDLPAPADPAALQRVEAELGSPLPPLLRRVYLEIADGGFGPGRGLLPVAQIAARHAELQAGDELPRGRHWPDGLLPLVERDPGFDCVDAKTGRVINWDPDGLSERSREDTFRRSFADVSPSVEVWLSEWVAAPTFEERMAARLRESQIRDARAARARIAAKTPEERAAMGLPEVGWERIVWGGIGLEEDE